MTYPQYQPPAGYAPQAPYAPAPQPAAPSYPAYPSYPQSAPPAAAPAPTYPVPQQPAQGQPIAPPVPQLRDGGGGGGGAAPKMRHLVGRTIIVEPVGMGTADVKGKSMDEAKFHLTVVDGGPIRYGDNVDDRDTSKNRPNTHESDVPCRFTNCTDIGFGFVQAVRDALDNGEPGRVGVVQQGTQGNRPYLITKCSTDVHGNERPDGQARFDAAMALFGKIWADKHAPAGAPRQFVNPEPRSLVAPPPSSAAPAVNYGQPQPAANAVPAQHTATQAAYPQGYGQYAPPPPPAYLPAPGAVEQPYPGVAPTGPGGMYMPQSAPPAPTAQPVPPQVEAWLATLPPEQQAGARAQYLAAQQPAAGAPASAGPGM